MTELFNYVRHTAHPNGDTTPLPAGDLTIAHLTMYAHGNNINLLGLPL